MSEEHNENHPDQPTRQIRCFTRAVKNARYSPPGPSAIKASR